MPSSPINKVQTHTRVLYQFFSTALATACDYTASAGEQNKMTTTPEFLEGGWRGSVWTLQHKQSALVASRYPQALAEVGHVYPSLHLQVRRRQFRTNHTSDIQ